MKIKVRKLPYAQAVQKEWKHSKPVRQSAFFRWLIHVLAGGELKAVDFQCDRTGLDRIPADEPCLILMNHSSFTDLMIIGELLKDREYHIVCTNDGFIGKEKLMRRIGCIPTRKFITDLTLIRDMKYTFETLKGSVVMYPEASYSFDGSQTPLPDSLGKCIRMMGVPVVMIRTKGAFLRDPLYNCLQKRKTKVSAATGVLVTKEECRTLSAQAINERLSKAFEYDHFREQKEAGIKITESFRADGLHRVLYKCPGCRSEGKMLGKGTAIRCHACGEEHVLEEDGTLRRVKEPGAERFRFITDWYAWERSEVRKEIEDGTYAMDADVTVRMLTDSECIYEVGSGRLHHDRDGFTLNGCGGELSFALRSSSAYSLYADYFWYELGDMVSIGDHKAQYYCFPEKAEDLIAAKAKLAAEEIYKMTAVKTR